MTNISLFFLQKCLPGQFYFHQTKCGWFPVIYGECGRKWLKILNAGESRKMRVSPAKCGWLGMYDMLLDPAVSPTTLLCITSRFAYMKHLFLLTTSSSFSVLNINLNVLLPCSSYCFAHLLPQENCLFLLGLKTQQWWMPIQPHSQCIFSNTQRLIGGESWSIALP